MKEETKSIIKAVSFGLALALGAVLYGTFLTAYASPSKMVTISINGQGEAAIELVILTVTMIFITLGCFLTLKK